MAKKFLLYTTPVFLLVLTAGPSSNNLWRTAAANKKEKVLPYVETVWRSPNIDILPDNDEGRLIKYGRELISNTSAYLGPKGSVAKISNGLNCQSCHLEAGTRLFGNNFAMVASSYPKYRERSGRVESIAFRIDECMERSMNGKKLDSSSKEMQAMIAYLKYVGKDVTAFTPKHGIATVQLSFLNRAADPVSGKTVFMQKCQSCHGADGSGKLKPDSTGYYFPPLWGKNSYNVSAGMYRLTKLAAFVKFNMPFTAVQGPPQLTDEEAWDVAAFINSQHHPKKFFNYDWPDLAAKPVDYPFGPFADRYPAAQHKYGPFAPLKKTALTKR